MAQEIICAQSRVPFQVSELDLEFYNRNNLPLPKLCPEERMRRRLAFRNEFHLYSRKCSLTGQRIFSQFSEDKPFPVYNNEVWWSDNNDAREHGRDFDYSKTFLENYLNLRKVVPLAALAVKYTSMQNSDYCNEAGYLKNCYLLANSDQSEACLYGKGVNRCFDCIDCFKAYACEGCYECLNCNNCTFSAYLSDCHNCTDCHYGKNLIGCSDCFGCVNLRNQKYCFFNEQLSEELYKKKVEAILTLDSREQIEDKFHEFASSHFVKWMQENNTENCTGDYLVNCKNCTDCYDLEDAENCRYCSDFKKGDGVNFDNMDTSYFGMTIKHSYESVSSGYGAERVFFSIGCYGGHDIYYSWFCKNNCSNVFGCIGLKKQEYCILNKQYSKSDYEAEATKIVAHMKETGEWGEFFPISSSHLGYNESLANEYYPITSSEAESLGFPWKKADPKEYQKSSYQIPKTIEEVDDGVLNEVLACAATGKNYKIHKLELKFYRKMGIPLPTLSPYMRHLKRFGSRNPRILFDRQCSQSGKPIKTTIGPARREPVLCEEEYHRALS